MRRHCHAVPHSLVFGLLVDRRRSHRSTINSILDEVGFIHATDPDQTIAMLNRNFTDRNDILLLIVDLEKVKPEVKFEAPLSGSKGVYPHIYGALNTDAVINTQVPKKDPSGQFVGDLEEVITI